MARCTYPHSCGHHFLAENSTFESLIVIPLLPFPLVLPHAGLKGDGNLYTSLPANKREEVEKLLNGSTEETWRHLAGELGYKEDHIDSFTQDEYPVRALLSDWSSKDSATMDALYSALRKIQRGDIVESLYSESTASSPV